MVSSGMATKAFCSKKTQALQVDSVHKWYQEEQPIATNQRICTTNTNQVEEESVRLLSRTDVPRTVTLQYAQETVVLLVL
jgi:hypothetical protein